VLIHSHVAVGRGPPEFLRKSPAFGPSSFSRSLRNTPAICRLYAAPRRAKLSVAISDRARLDWPCLTWEPRAIGVWTDDTE
jgi:hypothetical protein